MHTQSTRGLVGVVVRSILGGLRVKFRFQVFFRKKEQDQSSSCRNMYEYTQMIFYISLCLVNVRMGFKNKNVQTLHVAVLSSPSTKEACPYIHTSITSIYPYIYTYDEQMAFRNVHTYMSLFQFCFLVQIFCNQNSSVYIHPSTHKQIYI